ncbi:MAG: dihydropteroate synthase [Bacteroidaceae bacterium]|nr:dihydropteroate synthase [Bacteroidaceae bacterium]
MKDKLYTINANGKLLTTARPLVMGVMNVTPDSFYAASRLSGKDAFASRALQMLAEGADILDVGACSTRPAGEFVSETEELTRLHSILDVLDVAVPQAVISVDTFRGRVVRECVASHNVAIINDVSGYMWDDDMFEAVVASRRPYILTHSCGKAGDTPEYTDFMPQVLASLSEKVWQLHQHGVCDVIIDPGFGFGKSVEQNYEMLANLREFAIFDAPLLVGVSRKSMITKVLGCTPGEALNGTAVVNALALSGGAHILRVHDVLQAKQAVSIYCKMKEQIS